MALNVCIQSTTCLLACVHCRVLAMAQRATCSRHSPDESLAATRPEHENHAGLNERKRGPESWPSHPNTGHAETESASRPFVESAPLSFEALPHAPFPRVEGTRHCCHKRDYCQKERERDGEGGGGGRERKLSNPKS